MPLHSVAIADSKGNFLELLDEVLPIYSLAKPLIASTVFSAGVDIKRPVSYWIEPDLVPRGGDITVEQLLNHTSGLRDYGGLPEYAEAIVSKQTPWSDETFADHTLRLPLQFEPGQGWAYSNPGYWLLTQIVQKEAGLSLDDVIARYVAEPLGLEQTRVVHGRFADDLPSYPAEWVWHGVIISTARDMVRFMSSSLAEPLLGRSTPLGFSHPAWDAPHYAYGLMVEPDVRYGHNGEGPGYSASCFHFFEQQLTGCVLTQSDREEEGMRLLLKEVAKYTR